MGSPVDYDGEDVTPAMAARLYPRLDTDERIERAEKLLETVDGPLRERWRWFVGR